MIENNTIFAEDIDEAFLSWYELLKEDGNGKNLKDSRDGQVHGEALNAVTVIKDPTKNIMKNEVRKLSLKYAIGEMLWYLSENNRLDAIRLYTKNWDRISDDGFHVNSNYGFCINKKYGINQWEIAKEELKSNKESRRAVIHIKSANDSLDSKDVNCTVCLQYIIRDDKLYATTYMRSNDIWLGFPYDVFQFTCMQIRMAMELGVGLGTYTHIAGSLHLYERDLKE